MSTPGCIDDKLLQQNIKEDNIPCLANNETSSLVSRKHMAELQVLNTVLSDSKTVLPGFSVTDYFQRKFGRKAIS